jgi:hypothetical protein
MTTITVLDSIMGSGKTTYVIDMLNQRYAEDLADGFRQPDCHRSSKFLIVVPLLTEVDRFASACPDLRFKDPQPIHGKKLYHLEKLIEDGENIVTTHSLFKLLNRTIYDKLKGQGYTLIIDEVLDCVDMFDDLTKEDKKLLFENGWVYVHPTSKRLQWNYNNAPDYRGRFDSIKALCDTGSLVSIKDQMLLWEFPSEFLRCFSEVVVCTYLFQGSTFYAYLMAEGFTIDMKTIHRGTVLNWAEASDEAEIKERLRSLISIYEGSMNEIGREAVKSHPLSSTWCKKAEPRDLQRLRRSTENFFSRVAGTASKQNGWTTFSKVRSPLSGKGYARGWIPNNAKATNEYIEKQSMAYLCNWFYHPVIKGYFQERGITVNEEAHALSAMIQWVWRSQIRRGDPVTLFIPSERMRSLLKQWLSTSSASELIKATEQEQRRAA